MTDCHSHNPNFETWETLTLQGIHCLGRGAKMAQMALPNYESITLVVCKACSEVPIIYAEEVVK